MERKNKKGPKSPGSGGVEYYRLLHPKSKVTLTVIQTSFGMDENHIIPKTIYNNTGIKVLVQKCTYEEYREWAPVYGSDLQNLTFGEN